MAVLEIDQGRVGKLAAVGYEAEVGQPEVRSLRRKFVFGGAGARMANTAA